MKTISKEVKKNVFLFWGKEKVFLEEELEVLLSKFMGKDERAIDMDLISGRDASIADIINSSETMPFLGELRVVLIRKDDILNPAEGKGKIKDEDLDSLVAYLKNPCESSIIIFVGNEQVDRKRKLYKTIKEYGEVREFNSVTSDMLYARLRNSLASANVVADNDALRFLIYACDSNMERIDNEVEKLILAYAGIHISKPEVENVICSSPSANIFKYVDALAEKRGKDCLLALKILLDMGDHYQIIGMVARQFRLIYEAGNLSRGGKSPAYIASELGLAPFIVNKVLTQFKLWKDIERNSVWNILSETEVQMKSTRLQAELILEIMSIKLLHL